MKIKFLAPLFVFALIPVTLAGCSKKEKEDPTPPSGGPIENDSGLPTITSYLDEPSVQIHYQRTSDSYTHYGLWLWSEGKEGSEYEFNYSDDYGVIAYYPLSTFGNPKSLGFIVKQLFSYAGDGVWKKDYGQDRFIDFDMLQADEHQSYNIYLLNKKGTVYTDKERTKVMNAVNLCKFTTAKQIKVEANNPLEGVTLRKNGEVITPEVSISSDKSLYTYKLDEPADIADSYQAEIDFGNNMKCVKSVSARALYNADFDAKYNYDGELGAIYSAQSTTFKVWSPISQQIELRIYENGTPTSVDPTKGDDTFTKYDMVKGEKGVFSVTVDGNLAGKYYTYFVTNSAYPNGREVVDPYALSAGVSGLRGMIVDFSDTNPEGWDNVEYMQYDRKELTVYETHIAELTCSETWGGTPENAKLFKGFYEAGTTYTKNGTTVKTGFDHIKELGVNAVQIIPLFDQANNETKMSFNWGYNPLNYNVVEGGYSSNPFDGLVRIREFKELVKAYHDAGIAIIMDVVYNHVNGLSGCNFDVLMPNYYFRYADNDSPSNGSGCGNETASDKYMFRRFMIDSTKFWTEEYKLDGFRFDLMGIHDVETMNQLDAAIKEINPKSTIYGEPWAGGDIAMPSGFTPANQQNASQFVGYGQFNDKMRDAMIKSGMNTVGNKGWTNQAEHVVPCDEIVDGMRGITSGATDDPNKTVNYVSCHDNYTVHDRCIVAGISDEAFIKKVNILSNSLVFTSQGTTFMLAGEEMMRTKIIYDEDGNVVMAKDEDGNPLNRPDVSGNSYSSNYLTNQIDYALKIKHQDLFEQYQKLIALKQQAEGLHRDTAAPADTVRAYDKQIIKTSFVWDGKTVEAWHAAPSLTMTQEVDVSGKTIYLDTLGKTPTNGKITLSPFETLIIVNQ
ncbi:MAG: type I pullulanase [Bacilli bacterium]|nr:type I pullulanase [Bacilli bacterium]